MADLLMIVPTRGRPQNALDLYSTWKATSTGESDLLFAVDNDDTQLQGYREAINEMPGAYLIDAPRLRMVGTLNMCATTWARYFRYVGFMGDDHRFRTAGWDQRFVETLAAAPVGLVYGDDLLQGETMPTAVAMTSNIVTALGYMAPPNMVHLCVDLVWLDWGRALDRIIHLPDVVIEHMHPANGKAALDAGYEDANSPERVSSDAAAYYAYRDGGQLAADVEKLRALEFSMPGTGWKCGRGARRGRQ